MSPEMSHSQLALLSLVITLVGYYGAKRLYGRLGYWWAAPILLAPMLIIAAVLLLDIPLPSYFEYTHFLVLLLGPATIAFALPIYRERALIGRYPITLTLGVMAGLLLGLLSSWGLVKLFELPPELGHSVLVRSVSTPFAMEATTAFGGVPELTAMVVLMTGVIGMLLCGPLFRLGRVRSALARGAALGASAHGAGAAKAREYGEEEAVVASLTMIFTGIAMVLTAPLFAILLV